MHFIDGFLTEASRIIDQLDKQQIAAVINLLAHTRENFGRMFVLGVGGSAANAAHAVNDFRKIAQIEAYAPTDNVAELTARINDEGWQHVFVNWLMGSRLQARDMLFILSVGGGCLEKNISPNLVLAIQYARLIGAKITGIVGRDGGFTAKMADHCILIPTVNHDHITPHAEAFQAIIWHLMLSHPRLKLVQTKWEHCQQESITI